MAKEKITEVPCTNILKLDVYADLLTLERVRKALKPKKWTPKKVKQALTEDDIKRCKDCRLKIPSGNCWVLELLRQA